MRKKRTLMEKILIGLMIPFGYVAATTVVINILGAAGVFGAEAAESLYSLEKLALFCIFVAPFALVLGLFLKIKKPKDIKTERDRTLDRLRANRAMKDVYGLDLSRRKIMLIGCISLSVISQIAFGVFANLNAEVIRPGQVSGSSALDALCMALFGLAALFLGLTWPHQTRRNMMYLVRTDSLDCIDEIIKKKRRLMSPHKVLFTETCFCCFKSKIIVKYRDIDWIYQLVVPRQFLTYVIKRRLGDKSSSPNEGIAIKLINGEGFVISTLLRDRDGVPLDMLLALEIIRKNPAVIVGYSKENEARHLERLENPSLITAPTRPRDYIQEAYDMYRPSNIAGGRVKSLVTPEKLRAAHAKELE